MVKLWTAIQPLVVVGKRGDVVGLYSRDIFGNEEVVYKSPPGEHRFGGMEWPDRDAYLTYFVAHVTPIRVLVVRYTPQAPLPTYTWSIDLTKRTNSKRLDSLRNALPLALLQLVREALQEVAA